MEAVLNPKKKIEGKLLDLLKTNDKGEATYNGITLETGSGIIRANTLTGANIS